MKCLAIVNKKTCENRQNIIRYFTDTVLDLKVCTFLLPRAASDLPLAASKQKHSERLQWL